MRTPTPEPSLDRTGMRRVIFIVLDGVGVGALPDAAKYGDSDSNTLGNLSRIAPLRLPFMERMGLGNILPIEGVPPVADPLCLAGRLAEDSAGKDTTVGHWEHMGLVTPQPFPTYPQGFPEDILARFEERIGRRVLGNRPASGTAIIEELGVAHLATGQPIVYTSADSVFQIAAHVDVVPLERLDSWCEIARALLTGPHAVARVIARPFAGPSDAFYRTKDRHDYSLAPTGPTYLDALHAAGLPVLALGKIGEVFVGRGVSSTLKVASNDDNLTLTTELVEGRSEQARFEEGLLLTNLVDFDMAWGHRNDVDGFARGLQAFDAAMPAIFAALRPDDMLVITADHGVDPTTPSTDHSREYVPLLLYPPPSAAPAAVYEGMFADTGATTFAHLVPEAASVDLETADGHGADLAGTPVQKLRPARGWRHYTHWLPSPAITGVRTPVRVGPDEAAEAAAWLGANVGPPPGLGVVLGSGLLPTGATDPSTHVAYDSIPHWRVGGIAGHRNTLAVCSYDGHRVVLLEGRVHEYEGFDLSEAQLQVRTLAAWGVGEVLLTSASGGVAPDLLPSQLMLARAVLDFEYRAADGHPTLLAATGPDMLRRLRTAVSLPGVGRTPLRVGVHASLPGPQYETPAELELLRVLGVDTVSMSPAAELRAANECGLEVAVAAVVANAGDTTHEGVLAGTARAAGLLDSVIRAVLVTHEPAEP
jgi:phosphopentomutase